MIKAQDLRIGNFVELNGSYGQVEAVDKYNNIKVFDYYPVCQIKPIPLTEEILLKAGFDLIGTSYFIQSLPCIYFSKPYVEANHLLVKSNGGYKLTSAKYLHQLQNLYFALTGQELNIKL